MWREDTSISDLLDKFQISYCRLNQVLSILDLKPAILNVKFGGDNSSSTSPHLPSIVSAILRWTLDMGEKTDGEIGRHGDSEMGR